MRRLSAVTAAAAALGAAALTASLAVPAGAATAGFGGGDGHVTGKVKLTGKKVVPGPGDPDGRGEFGFKAEKDRLCYYLSVDDIRRPVSATLNQGARGENGPVVVTLKTPPRDGWVKGCITARKNQNRSNADEVLTRWELRGIKQDPRLFYVGVETNRYPDGALRGQLKADGDRGYNDRAWSYIPG